MGADKTNVLFNPESIREIAVSFQQSRILLTAYELDVFTAMEGHFSTAETLAEELNVNSDGLSRILNALTAMGLTKKIHGKYYNTEEASRYLVKGKPEYMSGLMHTNHLWTSWGTLTDAVRKGSSVLEKDTKGNENKLDSFIGAMHYRALPQAKIYSFLIDFTGVKSILDLGGGSGAFAMTFIKNLNGAKATLFDIPGVVEIAKQYAAKENMLDRFEYIKGDYLVDDYGSGYDLVFASAIIHINSFEENKNLVQKCFNSLNPGGQLVISDFIMNEDRTEPKSGALFAINMLVGTASGNTYTEKEICSWLNDAGFTGLFRKDTSFGSSLMIGRKP